MKNSDGLSDAPSVTKSPAKCEKCGATARLHTGVCVSCLLGEGLESADEVSRAVFESVIAEVDVPDKQWRLGDYEILDEIGRGGMGVIYLARQRHPHRIVAVKRVLDYHADSRETLMRFRREVDAAASLDHPNILPIYEVSESEDGLPFFSMKFATGGSLQKLGPTLRAEPRKCVQLVAKVARAVEYAHAHGILHRDLKPGNILLDGHGEPLVSDFGLAKWLDANKDLTKSLTTFGTPGYTAPEQAEGKAADLTPAADVYSLGAILFDLLTGRPPFLGSNALSVIKQASETPAPKLRALARSNDRDLETICARCLEHDPKARYQSAGDLAADLERWLDGRPIVARPISVPARLGRWSRRNPALAAMAALLVGLGTVVGIMTWKSESAGRPATAGIAVLPFESLSEDKANTFFADGIQDDILTKLAKVADLKVIGRTSVMQYRGKQDVREIANALRVSHVLEGTVRRSGGKVHVNAELVDARTDTGIWAEEYERDLNDVFAIEVEVAQSTANRLRAKVSAREKMAIQERPTKDLAAYDLYVRATPLIKDVGGWRHAYLYRYEDSLHQSHARLNSEKDLFQAVDLLNQAITRDPNFLLAYCWLAHAHDTLYHQDVDRTPGRLGLAKSAIDSAFRLKPDSGEAHLALGAHLYWGYFDYDRARTELDIARRALPNNPQVFNLTGLIDRRQNRWAEALRNFERAIELDPRNAATLRSIAQTYGFLRAYQQASDALDRALSLKPDDIDARLDRASIETDWRADIGPLHAAIEKILRDAPASAENETLVSSRFYLALMERDFVAAGRALSALPENHTFGGDMQFSRAYAQGLVARMKGDGAAARAAFTAAHAEQEKTVRARPDSGAVLCGLGVIDAALGRKEEALREGRRAIELTPVAKQSFFGAQVLYHFAVICVWTGERDLAIEQLETLAKIPAGACYGDLCLQSYWDSLRGDPRFERIVASLAPK